MKTLAIFASGTGTNADQICKHFNNHPTIKVGLIVSNKPKAGVLKVAEKHGIPTLIVNKQSFLENNGITEALFAYDTKYIILAGFLWLVPVYLVEAFPKRIVNIHPALLPNYGGKGMYGMKVHEAVKAANEQTTGISIHYVNERYDEGAIIFQAKCPVNEEDTPQDIATKIHELEHKYFPIVIEKMIVKEESK